MPKVVCGVTFPDHYLPYHCELYLFRFGQQLAADPYWRPEKALDPNPCENPYTGEGRFEHAVNLGRMLFPKSFEWNEWSLAAMRAFCEHEVVAISGCGGSGKSTTAALYALLWWLCAPNDSAVLIVSTTLEMAKKRIWKNIRQYYSELVKAARKVGDTVLLGNPRPCIRANKSDTAHGLYVVAVAKGEEQKGIDNLKGFHPKRLLMIGDETDSISQAVVGVGVNQRIGTIEYQAIWLGNDPSLFNPLGKLMQPEKGKAIGLQHKDWISHIGVKCLRFDGFDSPNIRDKNKWSGIIRQQDIDEAVKLHGANSPQIWIMIRGLHPPEGADNTVLSEALLVRYRVESGVNWNKRFTLSASLDPAFGGDRCVYRTFARGQDTDGKMKVLLMEKIVIDISADDASSPAEYQIANRVKELCVARSIPPEEFALDASGTGRGVASVLQREWSPRINICEFGGSCSDMIVSDENPRPASEEYDRKVTELWFSFREFVQADMIRGLDIDTAVEFCQRQFEVRNKKTRIESKTEMKLRGLPSPDLADCVVVYINMLREKGVHASVITEIKKANHDFFKREVKRQDLDGGPSYGDRLDDYKKPNYSAF